MTMPRALLQVLVALALILGGINACRPAGDLARLPGTVPAPAGAVATGQVGPAAGQGVVNLVVHWPERDVREFRAQLIPTSTDRIDFEAKTLAGSVAATASVTRSDATTTEATTSMTLDAATYDFGAKAYRGTTEIARANPARVQVVVGAQVSADLTLVPAFVPAIAQITPAAAKVGDTVVITGSNLGAIEGQAPTVVFNGATASAVTAVDSGTAQVVVPVGATVGGVSVSRDGVPAAASAQFWVGSGLTLAANREPWDTTAANSRLALAGKQLAFSAAATWVLKNGDTLDQYGNPPAIAFSSSAAAAGTIDGASGVFTAADVAAATTVKAAVGGIESAGITLTTVKVTAVTLDTSSLTLYKQPAPTGMVAPSFAAATASIVAAASFSAPVSISSVTWSASSATIATVSASGLVTALGVGSVEITARSIDDSRVTATASVVVRSQAVWDVAREFSKISNPAGAWTYGWMSSFGASLNLFAFIASPDSNGWDRWYRTNSGDLTPLLGKNVSASANFGVAPGEIVIHPGPSQEPSVARWTAPHQARVRITGKFGSGDGGAMAYQVQHSGVTIYSSPNTSADGPFDVTRDVVANQTLDFAVGGGYESGTTPLNATITEVQ